MRSSWLRRRSHFLSTPTSYKLEIAEECMSSGNDNSSCPLCLIVKVKAVPGKEEQLKEVLTAMVEPCLLYTSDAADE